MSEAMHQTALRQYLIPATSLLLIAVAVLIRIRFLSFPLERDEGEYAYMGSLILEGIAPYLESYNMKMPGIYGIYAVVMGVFGESITGIRTGLIVFNLASVAFVFLIARTWFGQTGGWLAAGLYSFASVLPSIHGMSANAEQFLLPFALGGVWLVISQAESRRVAMAAGVLMGIAMIIKQHGALFTVFAGIFYLFITGLPWRQRILQTSLFGCGCLLPFLITLVVMYLSDAIDSFLFWTFAYALEYATQVSAVEGIKLFALQLIVMISEAPALWLGFAIGCFMLGRERTAGYAPLVLLGASLLTTLPGLFFRPHYFILLMPAICLICTAALVWLARRFHKSTDVAGLLVIVIATLLGSGQLLLIAPLDSVSRAVYGANPFAESDEVAAYIKANTAADDRIAVLGSEPQIYFLSERRAATGYIYTYALMEDQPFSEQMQLEMIQEIETAAPAIIAYINVPNSWLVKPESSRRIFNWFSRYEQEHYTLVGQVLLGPTGATYYWDDALDNPNPNRMGIYVFKRR